MNIVPLVSPFPKVYARGQKGKIVAAKKSKEQLLLEVLVENIQHKVQMDYQSAKSYEEILKGAGYDISNNKKQKDTRQVAGSRKKASNKFGLKSKSLHNPSLMTEVIDIESQCEGL